MEDLLSTIDWSRGQFALTAIVHWLFVPLTIGLSLIVGIMESIYLKTGLERWKKITKFWMLLFGINFACGHRHYSRIRIRHKLEQLLMVRGRHFRRPAGHRRHRGVLP